MCITRKKQKKLWHFSPVGYYLEMKIKEGRKEKRRREKMLQRKKENRREEGGERKARSMNTDESLKITESK